MDLKRLSGKHKNNKMAYYFKNYWSYFVGNKLQNFQLDKKLHQLDQLDKEYVFKRVNYYYQLDKNHEISNDSKPLNSIPLKKGGKTYFFDFLEHHKYFSQKFKVDYLFGDITHTPNYPTLLKSRPISGQNKNSILMKWNKIRHFLFIKKHPKKYLDKQDLLVWRGKVHPTQPHRINFVQKFIDHPLCDIGKVNTNQLNSNWVKPRMTIEEQLNYKFIMSIEGNDVASNLKWVMSSNSIAVMPKPKFETWFMEGSLKPDYHYIAIKDDFSDLEEKLNFYINHPEKAKTIIKNANQYVKQFQNKEREDIISLLILEKYFAKTQQKTSKYFSN
ncbi:Glycosyl transferase family 90 [Mesonia phycicola]|uniref:Glycosyl transferase family 90 n=1 Tax=Mesonia phycicola TaxID=579105 RepID=A0A1M6BLN4_9FLAO|nr:glycosyl transferase family 90 [Mesonia phycicola]SHI49622.1 Glycosyl transferase family 90 [Mesonia phycicola]